MNLPIGEVVSQGINLKEVDGRRLVETFYDKNFSGYLVSTIEGFDGLEEGILLFKEGALAAAFYEYDFYGITVFGDSAVPQVFNSFAAKHVVADVVSLSNQQVDLVTAFNEKGKVSKNFSKSDVSRLIPRAFSEEFARNTLSEVVKEKESKKDIFKKLGLGGLSGSD
ncbi:MAG TPA: DUF2226 domain-containing protein [archaeon]|nr:DUF2226 domain-containing protein [archaeon]